MDNSSGDSRLADVREWPYARSFLMRTMNPALIEAHGERILFRSLNIGRTVAFVGAGVSMAYGRISWKNLTKLAFQKASSILEEERDNQTILWHELRSNFDLYKEYDDSTSNYIDGSNRKNAWETIGTEILPVLMQMAIEVGQLTVNPNRDVF